MFLASKEICLLKHELACTQNLQSELPQIVACAVLSQLQRLTTYPPLADTPAIEFLGV